MSKEKRQDYGEGSVYQRKSDGRWMATIEAGYTRNGSRRRVTVSAKTEAEVKRKLKRKRGEIARDGFVETSNRTTVKAWAETWLADRATKDRPKTHTTDRGAVNKWIVPTIGHKRLEQLTPGDVRAVMNALRAAGTETSTMKRYHGTLMRLLKAAVLEGINIPPRVLAVEPPAANVNDRTALTVPESLAVLEVASRLPHGSRWAVAFLDGLRQGEALGLTWPEVDLDAEQLTISWQLQGLPYLDKKDRSKGFRIPDGYEARQLDGRLHLVRPKSKAGWRVIPLVPWAVDALRTWRTTAPASPHGLVWHGPDGRPVDIRDDSEEWRDIQRKAEIAHPSGRFYEGHEIRHSTATLLMELGVPESVIIAIMGHSSIVVSRGYMHRGTDQAREALARVADRLQLGG